MTVAKATSFLPDCFEEAALSFRRGDDKVQKKFQRLQEILNRFSASPYGNWAQYALRQIGI